MKSEDRAAAYKQFFGSPAGAEFLAELNRLIQAEHEQAEDKPELARDHTQRAKGVRSVLQHIQIVTTEVKKRRPMQ